MNYRYTHRHAGCTIWHCMQTHLRKYVCSTGRKEASRSECYETLDVGCPGIECVTPALLEHRWRRAAILLPVCHAECKISLPSPGMLVVQSSADTLRDSIKNDHEDDNNEIALFSEISLAPPGGESIGRVDTATMLSASSIISNLLLQLALGRNFD